MNFKLGLLAAACAMSAATMASAATINVYTSVAPNAFGSPSYAAYVQNANNALYDGQSTGGVSGLPTYYEQSSSISSDQFVATGFASWLGQADPGTVFGPAFASELGNRVLFGLVIDGGGTQFSISQLSFNASSSDALNLLGFGFGAGSYNYSNDYWGILYGGDGQLGGGDDTFVKAGLNTQLVDGLVGRGSGNVVAAYCPAMGPCDLPAQQASIADTVSYFRNGATFTGTYSLGGDTGSATFNITGVPEPATWAMMIGGFGLAGAMLRRRRVLPA